MILGPPSPCFVEIDEAVAQLQKERGDDRPVVFFWQYDPTAIPQGAIIYNFDFPGTHFGLGHMTAAARRASEVWDFSQRNISTWRFCGVDAKHVPVGYHASMTRFERQLKQSVDVVFVGSINERRARVLAKLKDRGLGVIIAPEDRDGRDLLLSRCKCSINMLFYENGSYPMLRAAHLLANDVPFVGESAPEQSGDPTHKSFVPYLGLVDRVNYVVHNPAPGGRALFEQQPMVLP